MIKVDDFIASKVVRKILNDGNINNINYSGVANEPAAEIKSNYLQAGSETVINSSANAFIVLGKDRSAGVTSGMGGKGFTGASSIDLIAGHMGPWPIDTAFGQTVMSSKDFKNDSARVYISQMADVDEYFQIPKIQAQLGSAPIDLEHRAGLSTVAAKADTVRLIARENVKIVTFHGGTLACSEAPIDGGIDIIAGCNIMGAKPSMSLQPMVKGNNLVELLKEIIVRIDDVQSVVANFMKTQREINNILASHTHQSNKAGLATSPIIGKGVQIKNFKILTDIVPTVIFNFVKNISIDGEYFSPLSAKYINSVWNRVN